MAEFTRYIFGYGSLINPDSIARNLQEDLDHATIVPSVLKDFERSWSLEESVTIEGANHEELTMVFLNIIAKQGCTCNGVTFAVSEKSLRSFDKRERRYTRIEVGALLSPRKDGPVYTYAGKEPYITPPKTAVVSRLYEKIVDEGLSHWGSAFSNNYHLSTIPHSFRRISEVYTFAPE